jgi:hypothetical protein
LHRFNPDPCLDRPDKWRIRRDMGLPAHRADSAHARKTLKAEILKVLETFRVYYQRRQ